MTAAGRIRRRADFLAANAGARIVTDGFILLVQPTDLGMPRTGFTVSRKVGNAVARNRARRRLREMARAVMPLAAIPSADHVFIARPRETEVPFSNLLADGEKALKRAARKLGG